MVNICGSLPMKYKFYQTHMVPSEPFSLHFELETLSAFQVCVFIKTDWNV